MAVHHVIDEADLGIDSRGLLRCLEQAGIQCRSIWQPVHFSPSQKGAPPAECPVAKRLKWQGLSLRSSVRLRQEDQTWVIETIHTSARRG